MISIKTIDIDQEIEKMEAFLETFENLKLTYGNEKSTSEKFDIYLRNSEKSRSEMISHLLNVKHKIILRSEEIIVRSEEFYNNNKILQKYYILSERFLDHLNKGNLFKFHYKNNKEEGEIRIVSDYVDDAIEFAQSIDKNWIFIERVNGVSVACGKNTKIPYVHFNSRNTLSLT